MQFAGPNSKAAKSFEKKKKLKKILSFVEPTFSLEKNSHSSFFLAHVHWFFSFSSLCPCTNLKWWISSLYFVGVMWPLSKILMKHLWLTGRSLLFWVLFSKTSEDLPKEYVYSLSGSVSMSSSKHKLPLTKSSSSVVYEPWVLPE